MTYKKGRIQIRDTEAEDLIAIKDRLLDCDMAEMQEEMHMNPYEALLHAYAKSATCSTVLLDDLPVLIFGLIPDPQLRDTANGWMLVTKQMATMKLTFLRHSRVVIRNMLKEYPIIWNHVNVVHEDVLRWLGWCGAKISQPAPYGDGQKMRRTFILRRNEHVHTR